MTLVQEAVCAGARKRQACSAIGLAARTVERWSKPGNVEDRRGPPRHPLPNQLSAAERGRVLVTLNSE
jgi:putative transposase